MSITFVTNARKLADSLAQVAGKAPKNTVDAMLDWVDIGVELAQYNAPIDTGKLRDNIVGEVEYNARTGWITGIITSNPIDGLPYNIWQEYGYDRFNVDYPGQYYMQKTRDDLKRQIKPYEVVEGFFRGFGG